MIEHKHITKIVAVLMALVLCLCLSAMAFSQQLSQLGGGVTMAYESALFDTGEPLSVNIIMEQEQWEQMLADATSETYYQCDVEINGEMFYRVGIRPKGNTSLSAIVSDSTTDRYSFKLEFDQFVDGQTCYGLDKLILNNSYADATNMKEALVYDMFAFLGADASLYNYAAISVNGEEWGLYLALEAVEDSFALRTYGVSDGEIYKPDTLEMGGGGGRGNGTGSDLNYTDDSLDSYSAIWEGAVTDSADADHQRVVTALKNIAQGTDLAEYMDVDNLLKYMAVHVFSVNEDSLSGSMAHNYYLYESGGQLNLLPWDYNLAWGGMGNMGRSGSDSATAVVNDGIVDAFSGTEFFDTLMENEEYRQQYFAYLAQLCEEYILGGGLEEFYENTRSTIDALVESDPTAFYTYEEYEAGADTLYQLVQLRAQSILAQLEGAIATINEEQQADSLIDASHLTLSDMGSMSMGGGGDMARGGQQQAADTQTTPAESQSVTGETATEFAFGQQTPALAAAGESTPESSALPQGQSGNSAMGGGRGQGMTPPEGQSAPSGDSVPSGDAVPDSGTVPSGDTGPDGDSAQGEEAPQLPEGFDESQLPEDFDASQLPEGFDASGEAAEGQPSFGRGGMSMNTPEGEGQSAGVSRQALMIYGGCLALLVLALVFAKCYRRRPQWR